MTEEEIQARAAVIRQLAQGEGLSAKAVETVDGSAFGDYAPDRLYTLIKFAAETVETSPHTIAIRNALGLTSKKTESLTERRTAYLNTVTSMTYRTLVRHEQEGALQVAKHFDTVKDMTGSEDGLSAEWLDSYAAKADLEERVRDLETLVTYLYQVTDALVFAMPLDERDKFWPTFERMHPVFELSINRHHRSLWAIAARTLVDSGVVDEDTGMPLVDEALKIKPFKSGDSSEQDGE